LGPRHSGVFFLNRGEVPPRPLEQINLVWFFFSSPTKTRPRPPASHAPITKRPPNKKSLGDYKRIKKINRLGSRLFPPWIWRFFFRKQGPRACWPLIRKSESAKAGPFKTCPKLLTIKTGFSPLPGAGAGAEPVPPPRPPPFEPCFVPKDEKRGLPGFQTIQSPAPISLPQFARSAI